MFIVIICGVKGKKIESYGLCFNYFFIFIFDIWNILVRILDLF